MGLILAVAVLIGWLLLLGFLVGTGWKWAQER